MPRAVCTSRGLLLLLGWLLALPGAAAPPSPLDEPAFEIVGDAQSIPDSVATSLAEDASGLLWIGSTAGLVRYDGYQFRRYVRDRNDPASLGGNLIRSLHASADGRLWIGTDVDGLSMRDPTSGRFHTYAPAATGGAGLTAGAIFAIAEDRAGAIWVGTRGGGLDRLNPADGSVQHYLGAEVQGQRPLGEEINALLVDRDGDLWIGHANGLTRRSAGNGQLQAVHSDPNAADTLAERRVYGLFQAADGMIWVGTREGDLLRIDPTSLHGQRIASPEPNEAGGTASVFSFVQTDPERIWIGRSNGVEIRANDGRLLRRLRHEPTIASGLAGNDIRALLRDRSGGLWAGGFGSGLQRHDPGNHGIRVLRSRPGERGALDDPNVNAVLQLSNGDYWLGTRGSGITVLDSDFHLRHRFDASDDHSDPLSAGWITGLAQSEDGAIWLGSRDRLHRYDPADASLRSFGAEQGLDSASVRRLQSGSHDRLWVGTNDGVFELDPRSFSLQRLLLDDGQPVARDINAIAEDHDGSLWVGGALGLFQRPAGARTLHQVVDASGQLSPRLSVVGLLVDRRGRLWVDTSEGLFLRDGRGDPLRFTPISQQLGVAGHSFGANLLDDARGRIWTHQFMLDPDAGSVYELTQADGVDFGTGWFRAYTRSADGRLLFGGSRGLLVIDPQVFQPWDYQPPMVITDLRVDAQPRLVGTAAAPLLLDAEQRSFSVEFAALDYSAPQRLRYRYRLHGYDTDWIEAGAAYRVASYANLWPGQYSLQIQGSNRVGDWSRHQLLLPLRVLPAYWQTGWFAALALLALLALLVLVVRLRTEHMRKRSNRLQELVEQRTQELRASRDRAEAALEQLQGTQQQLVAAEKMASLGQLVAGVAHEINTPIGIALTAASHLEVVTGEQEVRLAAGQLRRSDLNHWRDTTREAMRLILGSLHRAHTLIASFKQVAVDQTSEQRREFELDQFLEEVRAALEPSYRKGGHQVHIECPAQLTMDTYPGALFQILTNLITNSVTHGFAEGQHGHIRIVVSRADGRVVLRYQDDGVGMASDTASRAFEPFFTTRRGKGGSGLGLHLVYNLTTQLLGGQIELRTAPGEGCLFVLELPVKPLPRTPTQPPTAVTG